jgi:hypothetical protein
MMMTTTTTKKDGDDDDDDDKDVDSRDYKPSRHPNGPPVDANERLLEDERADNDTSSPSAMLKRTHNFPEMTLAALNSGPADDDDDDDDDN